MSAKDKGQIEQSRPPSAKQDCPIIAGIRFQPTGKIYHFEASNVDDLRPGDFALVDTVRGQQLGEVVSVRPLYEDEDIRGLKEVKRRATGRDLALRQCWQEKEEQILALAQDEAEASGLPIKIVVAEFTFDGQRLTLLYGSEEKSLNLNMLQQRLRRLIPSVLDSDLDSGAAIQRTGASSGAEIEVELLQIGPRDQAKLLNGYGACGEPRCCSRFLPEFSSISIKMAKKQGVSLHPSAITGMCERLRCCLSYEYEQYIEACRSLPRRKKYVRTPYGEGKVVDLLPLKQAVIVRIDDRRVELQAEEVKVISK
jgi:cell fate regulator YaaT (PSP1 superfamily)